MNVGELSGAIRRLPKGITHAVPEQLMARPGLSASENAGRLDRLFTTMVEEGRGFAGGDGTYSLQLGDRTLFSFGDTYVGGKVGNFRLPSPVFRNTFVRQSVGVMQPGEFRLAVPGGWSRLVGNGEYLTPGRGEWYWPAGMVQTDSGVQLLLTRFANAPKGALTDWKWERRGTDVATLDAHSLDLLDLTKITDDATTSWGAAAVKIGDDVWAYGSAGQGDIAQQLSVAKASGSDIRKGWQFLGADGAFHPDPDQAARLPLDVSNQFSALPGRAGGVDIIAQRGFDPAVYVTHAEHPTGPFDGADAMRLELPPVQSPRYVYNTIAHPQFSDDERIVVSVNNNRLDGSTFHARDYRPRFLSIPRPDAPAPLKRQALKFGQ